MQLLEFGQHCSLSGHQTWTKLQAILLRAVLQLREMNWLHTRPWTSWSFFPSLLDQETLGFRGSPESWFSCTERREYRGGGTREAGCGGRTWLSRKIKKVATVIFSPTLFPCDRHIPCLPSSYTKTASNQYSTSSLSYLFSCDNSKGYSDGISKHLVSTQPLSFSHPVNWTPNYCPLLLQVRNLIIHISWNLVPIAIYWHLNIHSPLSLLFWLWNRAGQRWCCRRALPLRLHSWAWTWSLHS